MNEIAIQSRKYIKATNEAPFVYGEKQLHSIILPAMTKITDAVLTEAPVARKWSCAEERDNSHGWVDYWCRYRDVDFLIELKHGFISTKTARPDKHKVQQWLEANKQLDVIEEEAKNYGAYSKGTIRVAMSILVAYDRTTKEEFSTDINPENLFMIRDTTFIGTDIEPNWIGMWELEEDLPKIYQYNHGIERYPAIFMFCRVNEIL